MAKPYSRKERKARAWHFYARRNVIESLAESFFNYGTIWTVEATERIVADIGDELLELCGEPDDSPDLSVFTDDGVEPAVRYLEHRLATVPTRWRESAKGRAA